MEYDENKVDEMVLALLSLTMFDEDQYGARAWKGHAWEAMRSPCISVHARRWKVPLAFGKARLTDKRAGR
jgi:hypothetical protein